MLPIRSFQCRARQHSVFTPGDTARNQLAQTLQPRPSIFVRQWMTAVHLLDICCRMKFVSFKKMPAQFSREQLAHCGFASTRDSIDDHDHGKSICLRLPIFSTTNAIKNKERVENPNAYGSGLIGQWRAWHIRVADLDDNESDSEDDYGFSANCRRRISC